MKPIIIYGASGFGKEVEFLIDQINCVNKEWKILGYIDDDSKKNNTSFGHSNVLGNSEYLKNIDYDVDVVLAIGNTQIRKNIYDQLKSNTNISFPKIISPELIYDKKGVEIGEGTIICANNTFTTNIKIGNFNIINLNCTIGHDSVLENFVSLMPHVTISGNVHLSSNTYIGTSATILQGLNVGKSSTIGASALVTKNILEGITAMGIPARSIKK